MVGFETYKVDVVEKQVTPDGKNRAVLMRNSAEVEAETV